MTFQRRRHITKHDNISEKQQLFRCPEIIVFWRISLCFVLHGHHTEKSKRAENLIWQWMSISFCVLFCVHKPFLSINGTLWRSRVNKHSYFVHTHYLPPIFTLKNRPRFASGVCHVVQSKASWAVAQRDRKSGLLLISGGERTLCWQAASWASKLSLQVLKHHRDRSLRYPEWSWRKKKTALTKRVPSNSEKTFLSVCTTVENLPVLRRGISTGSSHRQRFAAEASQRRAII